MDHIHIIWRLIIKQLQTSQHFYSTFLGDKVCIELNETKIDLSKVTSKLLYHKFKTKKQTPPSAQNKMKNKYPQLVVDWEKNLFFTATKIIEFQYKILNDIVYTNGKLLRFKMIESPMCTFCQKENEFLEHLLFHCSITENFGLHSHPGLINKLYHWKR